MTDSERRVAVVAGARTPFVKAGHQFSDLGPLELAKRAVGGLIEGHDVDPAGIDALAFGVVVPEPGKPNLAREIVLESDLPAGIEAQTLSSYCITGLRTFSLVADAIARGRIECGIAGGTEWLSGADPGTFREPTTGLTMGEHMELTREEWGIPRERQDEVALASHRKAIASRDLLAEEIVPVEGVEHDTGPREDTSPEALAGLDPAFAGDGTLTAGNSSPVTDGASALLLMSEERARSEGREPLAFVRAVEYAAIHPDEGLLMAPGVAVPRVLERTGLSIDEMGVIEIHEAFAAQVLANLKAWETGWKKADPIGPFDRDRINLHGGSIAIGHPWSATGGRVVTTLANEMARSDLAHGLVSICAAGAMAGAVILERS